MLEKARIIAWPRAPRIDECRATASRENERIDAERRAAPIDMRVKVDQPRRDDAPRDVANRFALEACSKLSHATIAETDIHDGIDSLGRIDHASAAQDQIKGHIAHSRSL